MKTPLILATAALALAACSGGEDSPPVDTNVTEPTPVVEPTVAPEPTPEPTPSPTEEAELLPPEPLPEPDQQMLDDASATGMTARANREEAADEQPADASEQQ